MAASVRQAIGVGALASALIILAAGVMAVHAYGLGPSWTPTGGITYELLSCASDADLNNVYCVGGASSGSYTNSVEYASPSVNGSISGWSSTTHYPALVAGQSCLIFQYFIYCVGGFDGGTRTTAAFYSQLSPTGLGSWQTASPYPISSELQSCAAYSGYIYCVGGFDGLRYFNATYFAKVSSSGGIGSWTATKSFPTPIESHSCVASSGYIYCIGGTTNSTAVSNATYFAPLSSSGGIGNWTKTTSFPTKVYGQSCAVQTGLVYCVGGLTSSGYTNAVFYAPISSSGIGTWTATTAYPSSAYGHSCVTLSGFMYCVGGFDGSSMIFSGYSDQISQTSTTTVTQTVTLTATTTATTTVSKTSTVTSTVSASSSLTTAAPTITSTTTSYLISVRTSVVTSTIQSLSVATTTLTITSTSATTVTQAGQTQQAPPGSSSFLSPIPAIVGLVAGVLLTLLLTRLVGRRGSQKRAAPQEEVEQGEEYDSELTSATPYPRLNLSTSSAAGLK